MRQPQPAVFDVTNLIIGIEPHRIAHPDFWWVSDTPKCALQAVQNLLFLLAMDSEETCPMAVVPVTAFLLPHADRRSNVRFLPSKCGKNRIDIVPSTFTSIQIHFKCGYCESRPREVQGLSVIVQTIPLSVELYGVVFGFQSNQFHFSSPFVPWRGGRKFFLQQQGRLIRGRPRSRRRRRLRRGRPAPWPSTRGGWPWPGPALLRQGASRGTRPPSARGRPRRSRSSRRRGR